MDVRKRRLLADYNNIMDEFKNSPYISIEPLEGDPPERYLVKYRLKGYVLNKLDDNVPKLSNYHEVEIYLPTTYPRMKPKCKANNNIFHPNFRTEVCVGDYWGAGETLSDIIIQIGDMIQYKKYNVNSPLNAKAAIWTRENEKSFPLDNKSLYKKSDDFEIDLFEPRKKLNIKNNNFKIDFK